MDGTLVDTAELHYRAWVKVARALDRPLSRADFVSTFGRRNSEIIRLLLGTHFTDREIEEIGSRKEDHYRAEAKDGVALLPGVRRLLEELRQAGFRQAIGSSAPRQNLELILELTQTRSIFEVVVSMEDTQRGKPDPQVFLIAAARLQAAPVCCLVVEDAVAGVEAAKAGGMKCIGVTFSGHNSAALLRQAGADRVVGTLEDVTALQIQGLLSN
jgi:beta-phosphoglucomutase